MPVTLFVMLRIRPLLSGHRVCQLRLIPRSHCQRVVGNDEQVRWRQAPPAVRVWPATGLPAAQAEPTLHQLQLAFQAGRTLAQSELCFADIRPAAEVADVALREVVKPSRPCAARIAPNELLA